MPRTKPVTIGHRFFERQGEALEFFKAMLARYGVGEDIGEQDESDLRALLARHIHYEEKAGPGVAGFCTMIAPEGSKCFGVVRTDGTIVPFTYISCVTGRW
jgi:hypothetical protein